VLETPNAPEVTVLPSDLHWRTSAWWATWRLVALQVNFFIVKPETQLINNAIHIQAELTQLRWGSEFEPEQSWQPHKKATAASRNVTTRRLRAGTGTNC